MKKNAFVLAKILLLLTLITGNLYAQYPANQHDNYTPGSIFDTLFDKDGNKYALSDLRVPSKDTSTSAYKQSYLLCTNTGYFNLWFEQGCGMEGNSATEISRRNVLCQLFTDLSLFIQKNINPNDPNSPNVKVNVWVRDITQITTSPNVLGLATAFYVAPSVGNSSIGGIIDNQVWKTIVSGSDAYDNISSPLNTIGLQTSGTGAGGYFHCMMAFNFNNSLINWETTLINSPNAFNGGPLYDLYSVGLHEMTHAFGFASLINGNGLSKLGTSFPGYYARYDLFLRTGPTQSPSNTPLITNTGACNSMYNYFYNTNTTVLAPACTSSTYPSNYTNCTNGAWYNGSYNVPVYTPDCFEPPSSLSHFEDQCYINSGTGLPYGNDKYFVMSNANGTGLQYYKRYLRDEERGVLCDLGYIVGASYGGSAVDYSSRNYTGGCPGIGVAGVNDGISSSGSYVFTANAGSPINLTGAGILGNDFQATSFECLEILYPTGGSLNTANGNNSTSITYTPPNSNPGVVLLRYTPVNSSGVKGNITYVFLFEQIPACPATVCNTLSNGTFETIYPYTDGNFYCGSTSDVKVNLGCWNYLSGSPDLYIRGCGVGSSVAQPPNSNNPVCNVNGPFTNFNSPPLDVHILSTNPNNNFIGIGCSFNHPANQGVTVSAESGQTILNTPLIPGVAYTLDFWAICDAYNNQTVTTAGGTTVWNALYSTFSGLPAALDILVSQNTLASINANQYLNGVHNNPAVTYITTVQINSNLTPFTNWGHYSVTFTYNGPANYNNIIIANNLSNASAYNSNPGPGSTPGNTSSNLASYIFIDDVTLTDAGNFPLFAPPSPICQGQVIYNVESYGNPAGGSVNGPHIIQNGNAYSFNATSAATPGTYQLGYSVTNGNGCAYQSVASVVVNPAPVVTFNIPPSVSTVMCGSSASINLSGYASPAGGTFSGPGVTGNTFNPGGLSTGTYNINYSFTNTQGCTGTATAQITITAASCGTLPPTYTGPTNISTPTTINGPLHITSNLTISGAITVNFTGGEFVIDPGVSISLVGGPDVHVYNAWLHTCTGLWGGFISTNSKDIITFSHANLSNTTDVTVIEDASAVITIQPGGGQYRITRSVLNKNVKNIVVLGGPTGITLSTRISYINTSVLTCRDLPCGIYALSPAVFNSTRSSFLNYTNFQSGGVTGMAPAVTKNGFRTTSGFEYILNVTIPPSQMSANTMTVGLAGNNSVKNYFDNMEYGCFLMSAPAVIVNNRFQYMAGATNKKSAVPFGVGVYANSRDFPGVTLQVGSPFNNYTLTKRCEFKDCFHGTDVTNYYTVNINGNHLKNTVTSNFNCTSDCVGEMGLAWYKSSNVSGINPVYNVIGNTILNCVIGTFANNTFTIPNAETMLINNNNIDVNGTGVSAVVGIWVQHVVSSSGSQVSLTGNTVRNQATYAMYFQNINNPNGLNVFSNSELSVLGMGQAGGYRAVIQAENCRYGKITDNHLIKTTNNNNGLGIPTNATSNVPGGNFIQGINIFNSPDMRITCNDITYVDACIYVDGTCGNSTVGNNVMDKSQIGLWLDNGGVIGPQGTTGIPSTGTGGGTGGNPSGNIWGKFPNRITLAQTYVTNASFANVSPLNVTLDNCTGGTTTLPCQNQFTFGSTQFLYGTSIFNAYNSPTPCPGTGGNTCNPNCNQLVANMASILQQNVGTTAIEQANAIGRQRHAYKSIATDNNQVGYLSDPYLNNFYNSNQNTNIGKFDAVEADLVAGSYASAQSTNASVSPGTLVEQNQKDVNIVLLKKQNNPQYVYTSPDSLLLESIAGQCKHEGGSAVIQARALLVGITQDPRLYTDMCAGAGARFASATEIELKAISSAITNTSAIVTVYPNPSAGSIQLAESTGMTGQFLAELYSMTGELVLKKQVAINNGAGGLNLEVENGVYMLYLFNENVQKVGIYKLVINK